MSPARRRVIQGSVPGRIPRFCPPAGAVRDGTRSGPAAHVPMHPVMTVAATFWTDRAFRVMGTRARILVAGGPDGLAARGEALARELEARWTRFDADERADAPQRRRRPTGARERADVRARGPRVDAWRRTAGRFDPTGLDALVASGYDRDFAALRDARAGSPTGADGDPTPARLPGCRGIVLDPLVAAVTLPARRAPRPRRDREGLRRRPRRGRAARGRRDRRRAWTSVVTCGSPGPGPYAGAWSVESDARRARRPVRSGPPRGRRGGDEHHAAAGAGRAATRPSTTSSIPPPGAPAARASPP